MGIVRVFVLGAVLGSAAFGACTAQQKRTVEADVRQACAVVKRSLYVLENYEGYLRKNFVYSLAFKTYFGNQSFYKTLLKKRIKACEQGKISYQCVADNSGNCDSENETDAYVLHYKPLIGWYTVPGNVIHYCDRYFASNSMRRLDDTVHEFGRLEGIGDAETGTDDIYMWDGIVNRTGMEPGYSQAVSSGHPAIAIR